MVPAIAEVDGRCLRGCGELGGEDHLSDPQKVEGGSAFLVGSLLRGKDLTWVNVWYYGSDCFGLQWE